MLRYLNGETNCVPPPPPPPAEPETPNENYARELLELYTIGTKYHDFIFTQQSFTSSQTEYEYTIGEIAKVLSGWTFSRDPATYGQFVFDGNCHVPGAKWIPFLGVLYQGGESDGIDLLQRLADHWSTRLHTAERLCRWFLCDDPPQALITRVATALVNSNGSLVEAARAMFDRTELVNWRPDERSLFVRTSKFVYRAIQNLDLVPNFLFGADPFEFVADLRAMGNGPGDHPAPDGYQPGLIPNKDTLIGRWNFIYRLTRNPSDPLAYKGLPFDNNRLDAMFGSGAGATSMGQLASDLTTGGIHTGTEIGLLQQFWDNTSTGPTDRQAKRNLLALAYSAPSAQFQRG